MCKLQQNTSGAVDHGCRHDDLVLLGDTEALRRAVVDNTVVLEQMAKTDERCIELWDVESLQFDYLGVFGHDGDKSLPNNFQRGSIGYLNS
jgi:hypothetical protein